MKLLGSSNLLGLAVSDRCIAAAQVRVTRDRRELGPTAQFAITGDLSWEKPEALGTALRQFLRQHHFSASHAVIGTPARWLLAREKEVPPAAPQVAATMLRLQAERDFPGDLDLVFDYVGTPNSDRSTKVLLTAITRQHMDRILRMSEEAGLSVTAVTSSSLTLSAAADDNNALLSVILSDDSAELMLRGSTAPRMLKHMLLPGGAKVTDNGHLSPATIAALGSELQRAVALMGDDPTDSKPRRVFLWDGVGLDSSAADSLAERVGLEVRVQHQMATLGVTSQEPQSPDSRKLGIAVALAVAGSQPGRLAVDFLHTRLAAPKQHRVGRQTVLAILAGIVIVLGLAWLAYDIHYQQVALTDLKRQLADLKPSVKSAQAVVDKVRAARGWFQTRPPHLACLRDVTAAFPPEGRVYATMFSFRADGKGQVTGKAPDLESIQRVQDKLLANPKFKDVKRLDSRDAGGRSRETAFTFTFTYIGLE